MKNIITHQGTIVQDPPLAQKIFNDNGEMLIGIALIIGLFTGIAAFLGGSLTWNFIMAGAASTNGMLFFVSVLIILAWKVAGYIGLDYFLLPLIGTPWGRKPVEPIPVPTKT